MKKVAQERSILNRLEENLDIGGILAERYFRPELSNAMKALRKFDSKIRATVTGKEVEGVRPALPGPGLKELVEDAKSNLKRREYLKAIYLLSDFNRKVTEMNSLALSLSMKLDSINAKFLAGKQKKKDIVSKREELEKALQSKQAFDINQALIKRANLDHQYAMIRHAGIFDTLHNIFTERGRALWFWERKNPEKIMQLKEQSETMVDDAESLLDSIIENLRDMGKARASRDFMEYKSLTENFSKLIQSFNARFKEYDKNVVGPIFKYLENVLPEDKEVNLSSPEDLTTGEPAPSGTTLEDSTSPSTSEDSSSVDGSEVTEGESPEGESPEESAYNLLNNIIETISNLELQTINSSSNIYTKLKTIFAYCKNHPEYAVCNKLSLLLEGEYFHDFLKNSNLFFNYFGRVKLVGSDEQKEKQFRLLLSVVQKISNTLDNFTFIQHNEILDAINENPGLLTSISGKITEVLNPEQATEATSQESAQSQAEPAATPAPALQGSAQSQGGQAATSQESAQDQAEQRAKFVFNVADKFDKIIKLNTDAIKVDAAVIKNNPQNHIFMILKRAANYILVPPNDREAPQLKDKYNQILNIFTNQFDTIQQFLDKSSIFLDDLYKYYTTSGFLGENFDMKPFYINLYCKNTDIINTLNDTNKMTDIISEMDKYMPGIQERIYKGQSRQATASNLGFIRLLEKLSGESPLILSSIIKKHAHHIKHSDPVTSSKLLKIASNIK